MASPSPSWPRAPPRAARAISRSWTATCAGRPTPSAPAAPRTRPNIEQLRAAQSRALRDDDLRALLAWRAPTGKPLNLRGCNLAGTFLRGADLRFADLAFTDFIGADLKDADLTGAGLHESDAWRKAIQR